MVYTFDPLTDPRWEALVARHPRAGVFHTRSWLLALARTYGYTPLGLTTSAPGSALAAAVVGCEVRSWLTGRRFVSLPFSDHCEPLTQADGQVAVLWREVLDLQRTRRWRYVEMRGTGLPDLPGFAAPIPGWRHALDLGRGADAVFARFHRDCIQRRIRRAERAGLTCEQGTGEPLLQEFYRLLVQTRRRHGVPPQPLAWFRTLLAGAAIAPTLRIARYRGRAVAAMCTLRHRDALVYKYGASDARWHALGAMPWLFWQAVLDGVRSGCRTFDLGRSELHHNGLVRFKDHLGAERVPLVYRRASAGVVRAGLAGRLLRSQGRVLRRLPDWWYVAAGRVLYRHAG